MRSSSLVVLMLAVMPASVAAQATTALDARLSPDGTTIAMRVAEGAAGRLVLVGVAGDSLLQQVAVTAVPTQVGDYAWAPGGRHLVYRADADGHLYVVSVAVDGASAPRDLTPGVIGPVRVAGFVDSAPAALIEMPGQWPGAPDLYRVDLQTAERTLVATNDGGVTRWLVDGRGAARLAVRRGEGNELELARIRDGHLVPIYQCAAGRTCDPLGMHPDGRVWVRTNRDRQALALILLDPLTLEEEVVREDLSGDPFAVFRSDSLYERDVARLREQLGDQDLTFSSPTPNGGRMLVSARAADGAAALYLFDRWEGNVTPLATIAAGEAPADAAGAPAPDPAALARAELRYRITDDDAPRPTTVERRIERRTERGRDVWRVIDKAEVPVYGAIEVDTAALLADPTAVPSFEPPEPERYTDAEETTFVDAATLRPISREVRGPVSARLAFTAAGVTGESQAQGFVTDVAFTAPGGLWADGSALELLVAALPLAEGYAAQFTLFDGDALDTVTVRLAVEGAERVTTPAGEFDGWRLIIAPVDPASTAARQEWFVRRAAPHYLLRSVIRFDDLTRIVELTRLRGLP